MLGAYEQKITRSGLAHRSAINLDGINVAVCYSFPEWGERSIGPDHLKNEVAQQIGMIFEAHIAETCLGRFLEELIFINSASQATTDRKTPQFRDSLRIPGIYVGYDDATQWFQNSMAFEENSHSILN